MRLRSSRGNDPVDGKAEEGYREDVNRDPKRVGRNGSMPTGHVECYEQFDLD